MSDGQTWARELIVDSSEPCEGEAMTFVPICKHPKDFLYTTGPIGYERVDEIKQCPILVDADDTLKKRKDRPCR